MNLSVLKSLAFWVTVVPVLVGLLVSQGVILSGSSIDHIGAVIVSILGVLGGHSLAAPTAAGSSTTPPSA